LFAALPDRWVSWSLSAVPVGWRLVRRLRIRAIVSTYPIATAHLIGWAVHRLTGVPWIADCRDSMTEEHYPEHARVRRSYQWIERKMVAAAQRVVFTTPGALRMYASRYPECSADKWACLPNGYDEESFVAAAGLPAAARRRSGPLLLVHSGIVYPKERDPTQLFRAIADLRQRGLLLSGQLTIRLRAAGHEAQLAALIAQFGVQEFVELADPIPYGDALAEMLGADGLLVLQGASCNHQIPAKLYEYLRAGRPMLALADPSGDTGRLLAETGVKHLAALEDSEAIGATLIKFMQSVRDERPVTAASDAIAKYSRRAQTARLASLLDAITRDQ
jgi:glycosyltransferase involved in cell wall biosynthesis